MHALGNIGRDCIEDGNGIVCTNVCTGMRICSPILVQMGGVRVSGSTDLALEGCHITSQGVGLNADGVKVCAQGCSFRGCHGSAIVTGLKAKLVMTGCEVRAKCMRRFRQTPCRAGLTVLALHTGFKRLCQAE